MSFSRLLPVSLLAIFALSVLPAQQPPVPIQPPPAPAKPVTAAPVVAPRVFEDQKPIPHTSVKAQAKSGTCWCFATNSLLESELIRRGLGEFDLSEMHIVRAMYPIRATHVLRLRGDGGWGEGCQNPDFFTVLGQAGVVPESVYSGLHDGEKEHNHKALVAGMKGYLDGIMKVSPLSPAWSQGFEGILDAYLGKRVTTFAFEGKTWTPQAFAKDYLKINPDDYVSIGSFTLYPEYKAFRLETADNWMQNASYLNVPFSDFEVLMDSALQHGFTFAIASDISEGGFSMKTGHALLLDPDAKPEDEKELTITSELRARMFDNWTTTDDHSMHCVGLARDAKGEKFYKIKNSWGPQGAHKGYIYMSRAYMLAKTMYVTLHKDAVPAEMRVKLGIDKKNK